MAKKKKFPKQPKQGASLKVWENYKKRCEDVNRYNAQIEAEKKKKEQVKKTVQSVKSKKI
jgi:hypothetical protein